MRRHTQKEEHLCACVTSVLWSIPAFLVLSVSLTFLSPQMEKMEMEVVLDGLFHQNGTYDYDESYEYNDDTVPEHSSGVWIPVFYTAVLLVGLLGNGLILGVLALKRRSWTVSETFVLHLSVADVLLLAMLPFRAAQATQKCEWCFKEALCKISGSVFNVSTVVCKTGT